MPSVFRILSFLKILLCGWRVIFHTLHLDPPVHIDPVLSLHLGGLTETCGLSIRALGQGASVTAFKMRLPSGVAPGNQAAPVACIA